MARQEGSAVVLNFALQSTFDLDKQLLYRLLQGLDLQARLHWSPQQPDLLSLSFRCEPNHATQDRDTRAAACLEAVVRRLTARRM
jgi:hypothetical protein